MSAVCPICEGPLGPNEVHDGDNPCPIVPRGTSELLNVPIDQVATESNVRASLGDIEELAASIRSEGLLQPIAVHVSHSLGPRDLYVVDHGHRRLAACALAGLTEIPVIVSEPRAGVDRPIAQLVENLQRRDLNPLEEAEAFRAILDADPGLKQADLAGRIGRSAPYVSNALRILQLEPAVRELVEAGRLSGAHAKALVSVKGKAQLEWAKRAIERNSSSHELEDWMKRDREYEVKRQQREDLETEARGDRVAKAVAGLAKKKVPLDAHVVVYNSYGPWKQTVAAIREAGYTDVSDGTLRSRTDTLGCDCTAWLVDVTGDAAKVVPGCLVHDHVQAKTMATFARDQVDRELRDRVRARLEEVLLTDAQQTSRLVGRLALWLALSWRIEDWVKKWNGRLIEQLDAIEGQAVRKRTAWQTIASLTDTQLSQELAHAMATELRDQSGYPVDWQGLEAELVQPAPDLRTTTEVQVDVTAKRAARRATAWECSCGQKNAAWATECGRCAATRQAVPV